MGGMSSRTSRAAFEVYALPRNRAIKRGEVPGVFDGALPSGAAGTIFDQLLAVKTGCNQRIDLRRIVQCSLLDQRLSDRLDGPSIMANQSLCLLKRERYGRWLLHGRRYVRRVPGDYTGIYRCLICARTQSTARRFSPAGFRLG
jgi:hypothetical protein